MTASTENQDPPEGTEPANDEGAQAEAKFWEKFDSRLDSFFDRKLKQARDSSASRGKGRTTLPGILADFMFGPEKKQ